jgi:hypothetical protein|tara:strand:- start:303 stop:671 length:369 start_codon:yes stop_codon:yes gene_type:complete
MTEEILQAAILKLRSKALEQYGIIKDIYHRPAASDSVDKIAQHALNLAQIEGAVITLQQYSESLAKQTEAEEISNAPVAEEQPEESEQLESISGEELLKRSATTRKAARTKKIKENSKKAKE